MFNISCLIISWNSNWMTTIYDSLILSFVDNSFKYLLIKTNQKLLQKYNVVFSFMPYSFVKHYKNAKKFFCVIFEWNIFCWMGLPEFATNLRYQILVHLVECCKIKIQEKISPHVFMSMLLITRSGLQSYCLTHSFSHQRHDMQNNKHFLKYKIQEKESIYIYLYFFWNHVKNLTYILPPLIFCYLARYRKNRFLYTSRNGRKYFSQERYSDQFPFVDILKHLKWRKIE